MRRYMLAAAAALLTTAQAASAQMVIKEGAMRAVIDQIAAAKNLHLEVITVNTAAGGTFTGKVVFRGNAVLVLNDVSAPRTFGKKKLITQHVIALDAITAVSFDTEQ